MKSQMLLLIATLSLSMYTVGTRTVVTDKLPDLNSIHKSHTPCAIPLPLICPFRTKFVSHKIHVIVKGQRFTYALLALSPYQPHFIQVKV